MQFTAGPGGPLFFAPLRLRAERRVLADSILGRVAAGEAQAVEECLHRYRNLVWSLARRLSTDFADAEDAVQEVFIELWRSAARFDPAVASETTFVAMIARRRLIDRRRKRGRGLETVPIGDEPLTDPDAASDGVEIREEAARVRQAMQQLRPEEQQVLQLAIEQGLSQAEIAAVSRLPLGTVKTHARRGLARLRQLLGADPASAPARQSPFDQRGST